MSSTDLTAAFIMAFDARDNSYWHEDPKLLAILQELHCNSISIADAYHKIKELRIC